MSRVNVTSPKAKHILKKIVPLYLQQGSVSRTAFEINRIILTTRGFPEGAVVHANRLHTLLSNNVDLSINGSTFAILERVCNYLPEYDGHDIDADCDLYDDDPPAIREFLGNYLETHGTKGKSEDIPKIVGQAVKKAAGTYGCGWKMLGPDVQKALVAMEILDTVPELRNYSVAIAKELPN